IKEVAVGTATGHKTKAHCRACGTTTLVAPNAESRRAVRASTVVVPGGTDQVGNIVPQAGNIVPHAARAAEECAKSVSNVGNIVPRKVEKTIPREEVPSSISHVGNTAPHLGSETNDPGSVEEQYHIFDGLTGCRVKAGAVRLEALPEVSALLNLEELSIKDFLAELKAGGIEEMVLLKPETNPQELNSSSVMDEDVLEG
ncbi:hypothetical protein C7G80_19110, partial [Acinetobacter nosocomialis]